MDLFSSGADVYFMPKIMHCKTGSFKMG